MYNWGRSPTLANCTFSGNSATWAGGGMYSEGGESNPTLTNCTFSGNVAITGGGVCNSEGDPAFTNCTLDGDIGTGKMKTKAEIQAERERKAAELKEAGKPVPKRIWVLPTDGTSDGAYNAYLRWGFADIVDTKEAWEMTVYLSGNAPKDDCKVDLTPRRVQTFKTPKGRSFVYTVTDLKDNKVLAQGAVTADQYDLVTLKQIPVGKSKVRVVIAVK